MLLELEIFGPALRFLHKSSRPLNAEAIRSFAPRFFARYRSEIIMDSSPTAYEKPERSRCAAELVAGFDRPA
jgi:hypothetical protein